MTIQGVIAELQNLMNTDDIPCYYKGGIKKVIETIQMELSTIEVMEYPQVDGITPSVITPEVSEDMGEVSDGYHTFNQLYHQRAVLFATIVNQNKDKAWKSWKHEDGKFCFDKRGEWFIVGIDTPEGSYTYHYEQTYWDMFDCEELDKGKHWDGHTEEDVTRLLSLPPVMPTVSEDAISREYMLRALNGYGKDWQEDCEIAETIRNAPSVIPKPKEGEWIEDEYGIPHCNRCNCINNTVYKNYCPNCGAKMKGADDE